MQGWLVIGLGNPGERYEKTRHNLGFMLVNLLAEQLGVKFKDQECRSLIAVGLIESTQVELAKPQTYMNLSGEAVACLLKSEFRSIQSMIVVVDDLALPLGKIRIRPKGSSGGHNGLRSIIAFLGTEQFIRLRIGIRPEYEIEDTADFVLQNFSKSEVERVEKALQEGVQAIQTIIREGVEKAMANFN